jgi:hypothetical protein
VKLIHICAVRRHPAEIKEVICPVEAKAAKISFLSKAFETVFVAREFDGWAKDHE